MTLRFDVVNLFDTIYFIRDGNGIGVFAPQYGPPWLLCRPIKKNLTQVSTAIAEKRSEGRT
jgi:hypothetical protein